jgi:fatty acid desaturase (delta-4 desaturase)
MLLQQQTQLRSSSGAAMRGPRAAAAPAPRLSLRRAPLVARRVLSDKAGPTAPADDSPKNSLTADQLARLEAAASQANEDPWNDAKWQQYKWTVYRGTAYDLTSFMKRHPAGSWLLNLAIGRDCTALFESYHLRPEVATARLQMLPKLEGFPVAAVPRSPYPNDSELYCAIRERVRKEVFKGGEAQGKHRSGTAKEIFAILGSAAVAYALYATAPGAATGALLGLAGAWIGLTVQHCGNHGAMSTSPAVNLALGLTDDLIGGSSLCWRYHHQVSHHIHCNAAEYDEDVFSALPFLRFDPRQPREPYHRFQHIYMWMLFPFLQLAFQYGDILALFQNRTKGANMYGAEPWERATIALGKIAHYGLLVAVPWLLHGPAAALIGAVAYTFAQSIVLASTFAVSHNVPESKPLEDNATRAVLYKELAERDWGVQQVLTSANWGGPIGCFFTGGLNLQIEHHLFPACAFPYYWPISRIVKDECEKRGIPYAEYKTLPEILGRFVQYMKEAGSAERVEGEEAAAMARGAMEREFNAVIARI